jgi:hypothetical protein
MVRNISWMLATVVAVVLALACPTSANQGVPLGRSPGAAAPASTAPSAPVTQPAGNSVATPQPVPASTPSAQ